MAPTPSTLTFQRVAGRDVVVLPGLKIRVATAGGTGQLIPLGLTPMRIGSGDEAELRVKDPHLSGVHCELSLGGKGVRLRDLDSKNGTWVKGLRVLEDMLEPGTEVQIGSSLLSLIAEGEGAEIPLGAGSTFGGIHGLSLPMRALFAQAERVAATDQNVLIIGESGTGKDLLADALREHSPRAAAPFVVFDCAAVAPNLMLAELFGYERGAFTGADAPRVGLFERAHGGTLFLDEVGELPPDLQPQLLRVLDQKRVQRLGGTGFREADVRILAATHRDLRRQKGVGAFREDLFFRIAQVELHVPPLRDRREDIPLLVQRFVEACEPRRTLRDLPPNALALLTAHAWPGNVRELKNIVQRLVLFPELGLESLAGLTATPSSEEGAAASVERLSFHEAREQAVTAFERAYILDMLRRHDGNVSAVARTMNVSRQFVHRLLGRLGLRLRGLRE